VIGTIEITITVAVDVLVLQETAMTDIGMIAIAERDTAAAETTTMTDTVVVATTMTLGTMIVMTIDTAIMTAIAVSLLTKLQR